MPGLKQLPDGHRLSRRRRVDLADLAGDPFIIFPRTIGPNLYDSIIGACHAAGFAPSISMESPQISSVANLVSAGFGVAVVPFDATGAGRRRLVPRASGQAARDRHRVDP
ncbi:LysR substrate-binding domain-containing protein [Paraburkholderia terrae]|uniref:LysR substrate-binding domain-containing protein n=1 Tax=Paraburkholderia terrae TaxID=311230 RepID=UPI00296AB599|nr:LysR substrate-binding domain-containing protein [Paraburkholderia terrae]MDW3657152.1 LysR substrate-binding domain-containing protein [Paraburkholderia terrae]